MSYKLVFKNCLFCGENFKMPINRKFCSRNCYRKWIKIPTNAIIYGKKGSVSWNKGTRKKYKKICPFCKNEFIIIDNRQKYCSRKCYDSKRKRRLNIIECKNCNKNFRQNKTHKANKFCSRTCAKKYDWKNGIYTKEIIKRAIKNSAITRTGRIRKKRIIKTCPTCNKEFSHVPNYAKQVVFCSYKCAGIFRGETYIGDKSNLWRGGKSFEPYDKSFNNKFKREIRERDNQICMLCGIHREKLKTALHVHHINYNKLLSILQNCISLCSSCHKKTDFNREHWTKLFQSLLSEKYRYEYSEKLEPILNFNRYL